MATWPGTLPQQFEVGLSDERQQGFIRTEVDAGPVKQRRRFSATSRVLRGTMLMTGTQRSTFETFYVTTTNEGSDAFDFNDPLDNTTQSFRFVTVPTFRALPGQQWRVALELERLP